MGSLSTLLKKNKFGGYLCCVFFTCVRLCWKRGINHFSPVLFFKPSRSHSGIIHYPEQRPYSFTLLHDFIHWKIIRIVWLKGIFCLRSHMGLESSIKIVKNVRQSFLVVHTIMVKVNFWTRTSFYIALWEM